MCDFGDDDFCLTTPLDEFDTYDGSACGQFGGCTGGGAVNCACLLDPDNNGVTFCGGYNRGCEDTPNGPIVTCTPPS